MTLRFASLALACTLACPAAAEEHRQLGPHVHGHGNLAIAIEGQKVSIDLDVPGADIIGFEHRPTNKEEEATAKAAEDRLKQALQLFEFPDAAGCKLLNAKVGIEAPEKPKAGEKESGEEHEEHGHSDYNASYTLTCTNTAAIRTIHFGYFDAFAGAKALTVTVVGADRQGKWEATRDQPDIDLTEGA